MAIEYVDTSVVGFHPCTYTCTNSIIILTYIRIIFHVHNPTVI